MKKRQPLYSLLAITLVALLCNLNSWGVLEASEVRYAEISREMFRSGNLFHPTLLNIYQYHKPPITFWLTGLGFQLFGVNAFGDSFLTTLVLVVIYCMNAYYCNRQIWGIYSCGIATGIGFLTKGPAIFVGPFFFWIYLVLARRVDYRMPIKHLLAALVLCVSLGLSWYVYVAQQVPGLADYFIGRQVVARVAADQAFDRAKPDWYYPLILMTTTLPWEAVWITSSSS